MKAKPILLVILTLVIGFILGMLTSAQIRFNKLKPVRLYFSEERFREGFYKTIGPDEKQKAEIEKILNKYAKLNSDLQNNFRKDLNSNIDNLRKELDSKLTREQLARLKEMDERRQEMIEQNRRNRNDSTGNRFNRHGDRRDFRSPNPDDRRMRPENGPMPPEGGPMSPEDRPMPPGDMPPMPPQDSILSPDGK
jgi:hypothetical protein